MTKWTLRTADAQESRAVAGKPRDAAVIFKDGNYSGFSRTGIFNSPTLKTLPRTKHEVDRITRCGDMAI